MGKVLILFSLLSLAFGGVPKNRFNICNVIDCGATKEPLKSTTSSTTEASGKDTNIQQQLVNGLLSLFSWKQIFETFFPFLEPIGRKG